jgi:hypothetical protein
MLILGKYIKKTKKTQKTLKNPKKQKTEKNKKKHGAVFFLTGFSTLPSGGRWTSSPRTTPPWRNSWTPSGRGVVR